MVTEELRKGRDTGRLNDNRGYLRNNKERHLAQDCVESSLREGGKCDPGSPLGGVEHATASSSPPGSFMQSFRKLPGSSSNSVPPTLHIKATSAQSGSTKECVRFKYRDTSPY